MARTPGPLGAINKQVDDASMALKGLRTPAEEAASDIERAFGRAGESLAKSLSRAASDGKISLGELASTLIRAVGQASAPASGGSGGFGDILSVILKNAFGGARADGGLVARGQSYLVGERGPELFRPAATGQIEPVTGGANITVNLNMSGSGAGLIRSESQIASAIARAARLGGR